MLVSVLSALQAEIDMLVDSLDTPGQTSVAGWPIWAGSLHGIDVVLARAGLGKVNTAALSAIIWERHQPELMLFTGVAGGLDPTLAVGDVVVGERTIQHDSGVLGPDGLDRYQPGHVPFFNPTDDFGYRPSDALLTTMRSVVAGVELTGVLDRAPSVEFGTIITGDQFLDDDATRARLFADLGAQAIDMEGGALGQVSSRLGVDHLVIRSLSDRAGDGAIDDFGHFLSVVSENSARLVLALLRRLEEHDGYLPIGS